MGFVSGIQGSVKFASTTKPFKRWRLRTRVIKPTVTNFNGADFQEKVSGVQAAEVEIEGPWDVAGMAITAGSTVALELDVTTTVKLNVSAIIDYEASNDVEDSPRLTITGDSTGTFDITIP